MAREGKRGKERAGRERGFQGGGPPRATDRNRTYKVRDTRHNATRPGEYGIPPPPPGGARQRFPYPSTTGGSRRSISGNLDGRTDGRVGWELIYRDDTSILLAVYITARRRMREINYYGVRATGSLRCFHFSAPRSSFSLSYIFLFLYTELG